MEGCIVLVLPRSWPVVPRASRILVRLWSRGATGPGHSHVATWAGAWAAIGLMRYNSPAQLDNEALQKQSNAGAVR